MLCVCVCVRGCVLGSLLMLKISIHLLFFSENAFYSSLMSSLLVRFFPLLLVAYLSASFSLRSLLSLSCVYVSTIAVRTRTESG